MGAATGIPVRAAATSDGAEFEADRDPRLIRLRLRGVEAAVSTVRANLDAPDSAPLAAALGEVAQRCHGAAALAGTHLGPAVPAELLALRDIIDRCARLVVLALPGLAATRLPLLHLATEAEQTLTRWSLEAPAAHADDRALGRELLSTVHAFLALAYPVP
ncbi:hypothetical protein [Nocardia harenae]|uniref:hypothetical protein n=1 Tax=Nocardia harenae TaxID=358707 RepID=UPI0008359DE1|nr:hypothetical protein [Nocardia harenae]